MTPFIERARARRAQILQEYETTRIADLARKYGLSKQFIHQLIYRQKFNARRMLQRAIKRGKVERQPCEICGEIETEAHHDDYDKPLEVRWLCAKHHEKPKKYVTRSRSVQTAEPAGQ